MSKKKTRKKTKMTAANHKTYPSQPAGIKISEAIIELCEPLRNRYREPQQVQSIISLTVLAWNLSLFPKGERRRLDEMLVDSLPAQFSGEDVGILLDNIKKLIERKEKDFPDIRAYILNYQVSFSGDSVTLTVGTSPIMEINRKASQ